MTATQEARPDLHEALDLAMAEEISRAWDLAHADETVRDVRDAYCAGLYKLAAILRANRDVPLPFDGTTSPICWALSDEPDPRAALDAVARALPDRVEEQRSEGFVHFETVLAGLRVGAFAGRSLIPTPEAVVVEPAAICPACCTILASAS